MKRGKNQERGIGLVRSTSFGRKRVSFSNLCLDFGDDNDVDDDDCVSLRKRRCLRVSFQDLPQEIMIRILCGVDHADLKSLFFVSKSVREATLVAKETHFAYSTPLKKLTLAEDEAPNAPKQSRVHRPRLSAKKLADISVNLFV